MTDEAQGPRGEATWKQHREAISKRNAETRKRARAERKSQDRVVETRNRVRAAREAEELRELNHRIAERRAGRSQ